MRKLHFVSAVTAFFLILFFAWVSRGPVAAQEKPQPLQKWDYKLVNVTPVAVNQMEAKLNKLGSEGWELCSTVVPFVRGTDEYVVSFVFKRPKR
jgi:hypothetical protein